MARWMTTAVLLLHTTLLPAQGGGQEETALRQLWSQFEEAFNRSDAARVASLYAPDGDRINRDLEVARGRAEIARQYEKEFAARKADPSTIPFRAQLTIRLLDASVALLDGEWEGF